MNRHTVTLAQISPLQVRQGLLFSLALLLTLIAGQRYHTWQAAHDARGVSSRVALVVKVPVRPPTMLMPSRPAAVSAAPSDAATPRDRWVF